MNPHSPDFDEVESIDQLSPLPWREKKGIGLLEVEIPAISYQVQSMKVRETHVLLKPQREVLSRFFCKTQHNNGLSIWGLCMSWKCFCLSYHFLLHTMGFAQSLIFFPFYETKGFKSVLIPTGDKTESKRASKDLASSARKH